MDTRIFIPQAKTHFGQFLCLSLPKFFTQCEEILLARREFLPSIVDCSHPCILWTDKKESFWPLLQGLCLLSVLWFSQIWTKVKKNQRKSSYCSLKRIWMSTGCWNKMHEHDQKSTSFSHASHNHLYHFKENALRIWDV